MGFCKLFNFILKEIIKFYLIKQFFKYLGNWHLYISSENVFTAGDTCFKNNHTLVDNNNLKMVQQWFE